MSRKFGIELEYSSDRIDRQALLSAFTEVINDHPGHHVSNHETFRRWTVKGDGSCGHEITSPALDTTLENMNAVKSIVDGLRSKIRGRNIVRRSCGFHVHFDISEFTDDQIRNLLKIFYAFEPALLKLQPASRTGNGYCRTLGEQNASDTWINTFDPEASSTSGTYFVFDHCTGINFGRFNSRGTIEIRYGASTVRGIKVVNWVKLLLALIEISKGEITAPLTRTQNISDLIAFINGHNIEVDWLNDHKRRVSRWMGNRITELSTPRPRRQRAASPRGRNTESMRNMGSPRAQVPANDDSWRNYGYDDDEDEDN